MPVHFWQQTHSISTPRHRLSSSLYASQIAGFTTVELLVSMAVIGLLISLAVPAVMAARETARRAECANRLRQWGTAITAYEGSHRTLPFGGDCSESARWSWTSAQVLLLPNLDQSSAYESLMQSRRRATESEEMNFKLPVFHCPAEVELRGLNYRTCTGAGFRFDESVGDTSETIAEYGAFHGGKGCNGVSLADVKDGLSNTVAMSERTLGSGSGGRFDRKRDIWFSGVIDYGWRVENARIDDAVSVCESLSGDPGPLYSSFAGFDYAAGDFLHTSYNHAVVPNAILADCSLQSLGEEGPASTWSGNAHLAVVAARSFHNSNVVNVLYLDGAVRPYTSLVDQDLWRAISTRNGTETILE